MRRAAAVITLILICCIPSIAGTIAKESYGYGESRFTRLIRESWAATKTPGAASFYAWMDKAYAGSKAKLPGKEKLSLRSAITAEKRTLSGISKTPAKTQEEMKVLKWAHKMVKTTIPKFSLDRGFEFAYTVKYGERQCFLQSVLITGILQDMGIDAGVAMVYKNIAGDETNNGHAVTLVKLPDGRDIIVDASDPVPFVKHQGLFLDSHGYKFVRPVYGAKDEFIRSYKSAATKAVIPTKQARGLDYDFIRSQFYYYRGERVPGGLIASKQTKKGMQASAGYLNTSVRICPRNPLAVYMLGRAYHGLGNMKEAKRHFAMALALYRSFGWVPDGPVQSLSSMK